MSDAQLADVSAPAPAAHAAVDNSCEQHEPAGDNIAGDASMFSDHVQRMLAAVDHVGGKLADLIKAFADLANHSPVPTPADGTGDVPLDPLLRKQLADALEEVCQAFNSRDHFALSNILGSGRVPRSTTATLLGLNWTGSLRVVYSKLAAIRADLFQHDGLLRKLSDPNPLLHSHSIDALYLATSELESVVKQIRTGDRPLREPFQAEKFAQVEQALRELRACSPLTATSAAVRFAEQAGLQRIVNEDLGEYDEYCRAFPARAALLSLCGPAFRFVRAVVYAGLECEFGALGRLAPLGRTAEGRFSYYLMADLADVDRRRNGPLLGSWQWFDVADEIGRPRAIAGVRLLLWLAALCDPEYFHETPSLIEHVAPLIAVRFVNDPDGTIRIRPHEETAHLVYDGAQRVAAAVLRRLRDADRV